MKKTLLLCITFGIFFIPYTWTKSYLPKSNYEVNLTKQNDHVDLHGDLQRSGGTRSGTDPIVAELQATMLFVHFQKDVGTLQVNITGPQGQVYATAVDTQTPSELVIPLMGLSIGNYTITFSGERGMMWGSFYIN